MVAPFTQISNKTMTYALPSRLSCLLSYLLSVGGSREDEILILALIISQDAPNCSGYIIQQLYLQHIPSSCLRNLFLTHITPRSADRTCAVIVIPGLLGDLLWLEVLDTTVTHLLDRTQPLASANTSANARSPWKHVYTVWHKCIISVHLTVLHRTLLTSSMFGGVPA